MSLKIEGYSVLISIYVLLCLAFVVIAFLLFYLLKYRKQIKTLKHEKENFITLCDIIQAPIWFKDKDLKLTWVNEYYAMMYDKDREELIGKIDRDIAPKKFVDGYVRDDEYVLESKKVYKYQENEKMGLWYETTKFPLLDKNNELYGIGGVAFNITAIKTSEIMLHNLVHNDYLTGISNRLFVSVETTNRLAKADEGHFKLAVILLDLDNFKDLNDFHGHVIGDQILREVAERLKGYVQNKDILLGRFGGDEFVIIIPEVRDEAIIKKVCEEIKETLKPNYLIFGSTFNIESSMGIGVYPDHSTDYEGLIRHADMALFYAKKHGRNSIVKYSDAIGHSNMKRIKIESRLKGAIERGEFFLYYQPKLTADGKRFVGMETLLRWNNPELGFVSPGDFIPIAEQSDIIVEIGDWVLRNAMIQNLKWKESNGEMFNIAVNLSVKQIRQPDFLDKLLNLLDELNYPPEYLELELTEGMLVDSSDTAREIFEKLRGMGIRISIDDFGTGYSNLGYLSKFPLDTVKIDRRFVTDINDIAEKQQIVSAIIELARSFKLSLIAEGVETGSELDYLRRKGVDVIQGFYFSKPLPVSDILGFIADVRSGKYEQAEI